MGIDVITCHIKKNKVLPNYFSPVKKLPTELKRLYVFNLFSATLSIFLKVQMRIFRIVTDTK